MQEKEQNISPIKQRILQFVDSLEISKREFYDRTGISRGTLESPTGITEDTLTKFFATFTEISPVWVLTGNGPVIKRQDFNVISDPEGEYRATDLAYMEIISRKISKIQRLSKKIDRLKSECILLENHK